MEEYWNCRNYTVESKLGEYPGVFIIMAIFLIIGTFLFWVLRCFFNSIEDHRMNINIFLNKRITHIMIVHIYILVNINIMPVFQIKLSKIIKFKETLKVEFNSLIVWLFINLIIHKFYKRRLLKRSNSYKLYFSV